MYAFRLTHFECDPEVYTRDVVETLVGQPGRTLQDNKNSLVKLVEYGGRKIIVKELRGKDRRRRMRLLTLFREGRAVRSLRSMDLLNRNGILANKPLCAIEYKRFGMVCRSYMIYEYIDGQPVGKDQLDAVLALLRKIHALGYLHGDCKKANFLRTANGVATIDCVLKQGRLGRISEYVQYMKVFRALDATDKQPQYLDAGSVVYKLARLAFSLSGW